MRKKPLRKFGQEDTTTLATPSRPMPAYAKGVVGATLTVLSGSESGKILFVDPEGGILGRGETAEYSFSDSSISREHARLVQQGQKFEFTDLGSMNGCFVDGERVHGSVLLPDSCRIQLANHTMLQFATVDTLGAQAVERLSQTMLTDPLTGTGNRFHLQQSMEQEVHYARRHKTSVGMILIDLDHFKRVNDDHGHPAGDLLLEQVGLVLIEAVRSEDAVFRYGGEEFCILVREMDIDGMKILAERLREVVARIKIRPADTTIQVTASFGVSMLSDVDDSDDTDSLLLCADKALYAAKQQGRDQVVVYSEMDS